MRARVATVMLLVVLAAAVPALAGPDPEPDGPDVFIAYPGAFSVREGQVRRVVANVRITHEGGPSTVPLRVCVSTNGLRRVRVSQGKRAVRGDGRSVCWREPALSKGKRIRAVVRADIPVFRGERKPVEIDTTVELFAVGSTTAAQERDGVVRVR